MAERASARRNAVFVGRSHQAWSSRLRYEEPIVRIHTYGRIMVSLPIGSRVADSPGNWLLALGTYIKQ